MRQSVGHCRCVEIIRAKGGCQAAGSNPPDPIELWRCPQTGRLMAISENAWLSRNTPEVSSDRRFRCTELNGVGRGKPCAVMSEVPFTCSRSQPPYQPIAFGRIADVVRGNFVVTSDEIVSYCSAQCRV